MSRETTPMSTSEYRDGEAPISTSVLVTARADETPAEETAGAQLISTGEESGQPKKRPNPESAPHATESESTSLETRAEDCVNSRKEADSSLRADARDTGTPKVHAETDEGQKEHSEQENGAAAEAAGTPPSPPLHDDGGTAEAFAPIDALDAVGGNEVGSPSRVGLPPESPPTAPAAGGVVRGADSDEDEVFIHARGGKAGGLGTPFFDPDLGGRMGNVNDFSAVHFEGGESHPHSSPSAGAFHGAPSPFSILHPPSSPSKVVDRPFSSSSPSNASLALREESVGLLVPASLAEGGANGEVRPDGEAEGQRESLELMGTGNLKEASHEEALKGEEESGQTGEAREKGGLQEEEKGEGERGQGDTEEKEKNEEGKIEDRKSGKEKNDEEGEKEEEIDGGEADECDLHDQKEGTKKVGEKKEEENVGVENGGSKEEVKVEESRPSSSKKQKKKQVDSEEALLCWYSEELNKRAGHIGISAQNAMQRLGPTPAWLKVFFNVLQKLRVSPLAFADQPRKMHNHHRFWDLRVVFDPSVGRFSVDGSVDPSETAEDLENTGVMLAWKVVARFDYQATNAYVVCLLTAEELQTVLTRLKPALKDAIRHDSQKKNLLEENWTSAGSFFCEALETQLVSSCKDLPTVARAQRLLPFGTTQEGSVEWISLARQYIKQLGVKAARRIEETASLKAENVKETKEGTKKENETRDMSRLEEETVRRRQRYLRELSELRDPSRILTSHGLKQTKMGVRNGLWILAFREALRDLYICPQVLDAQKKGHHYESPKVSFALMADDENGSRIALEAEGKQEVRLLGLKGMGTCGPQKVELFLFSLLAADELIQIVDAVTEKISYWLWPCLSFTEDSLSLREPLVKYVVSKCEKHPLVKRERNFWELFYQKEGCPLPDGAQWAKQCPIWLSLLMGSGGGESSSSSSSLLSPLNQGGLNLASGEEVQEDIKGAAGALTPPPSSTPVVATSSASGAMAPQAEKASKQDQMEENKTAWGVAGAKENFEILRKARQKWYASELVDRIPYVAAVEESQVETPVWLTALIQSLRELFICPHAVVHFVTLKEVPSVKQSHVQFFVSAKRGRVLIEAEQGQDDRPLLAFRLSGKSDRHAVKVFLVSFLCQTDLQEVVKACSKRLSQVVWGSLKQTVDAASENEGSRARARDLLVNEVVAACRQLPIVERETRYWELLCKAEGKTLKGGAQWAKLAKDHMRTIAAEVSREQADAALEAAWRHLPLEAAEAEREAETEQTNTAVPSASGAASAAVAAAPAAEAQGSKSSSSSSSASGSAAAAAVSSSLVGQVRGFGVTIDPEKDRRKDEKNALLAGEETGESLQTSEQSLLKKMGKLDAWRRLNYLAERQLCRRLSEEEWREQSVKQGGAVWVAAIVAALRELQVCPFGLVTNHRGDVAEKETFKVQLQIVNEESADGKNLGRFEIEKSKGVTAIGWKVMAERGEERFDLYLASLLTIPELSGVLQACGRAVTDGLKNGVGGRKRGGRRGKKEKERVEKALAAAGVEGGKDEEQEATNLNGKVGRREELKAFIVAECIDHPVVVQEQKFWELYARSRGKLQPKNASKWSNLAMEYIWSVVASGTPEPAAALPSAGVDTISQARSQKSLPAKEEQRDNVGVMGGVESDLLLDREGGVLGGGGVGISLEQLRGEPAGAGAGLTVFSGSVQGQRHKGPLFGDEECALRTPALSDKEGQRERDREGGRNIYSSLVSLLEEEDEEEEEAEGSPAYWWGDRDSFSLQTQQQQQQQQHHGLTDSVPFVPPRTERSERTQKGPDDVQLPHLNPQLEGAAVESAGAQADARRGGGTLTQREEEGIKTQKESAPFSTDGGSVPAQQSSRTVVCSTDFNAEAAEVGAFFLAKDVCRHSLENAVESLSVLMPREALEAWGIDSFSSDVGVEEALWIFSIHVRNHGHRLTRPLTCRALKAVRERAKSGNWKSAPAYVSSLSGGNSVSRKQVERGEHLEDGEAAAQIGTLDRNPAAPSNTVPPVRTALVHTGTAGQRETARGQNSPTGILLGRSSSTIGASWEVRETNNQKKARLFRERKQEQEEEAAAERGAKFPVTSLLQAPTDSAFAGSPFSSQPPPPPLQAQPQYWQQGSPLTYTGGTGGGTWPHPPPPPLSSDPSGDHGTFFNYLGWKGLAHFGGPQGGAPLGFSSEFPPSVPLMPSQGPLQIPSSSTGAPGVMAARGLAALSKREARKESMARKKLLQVLSMKKRPQGGDPRGQEG